MRQAEEDLVCQMLSEENCAFSAERRTEVETLARKRPEVVVATLGVGTADARDALEIVATRRETLAELLDTLQAVHAVGGGVLLIVPGAEVVEVPLEDGMQVVPTAGNVPIPRRGRDRDCRAHINIYGRNELPASDRGRGHRAAT